MINKFLKELANKRPMSFKKSMKKYKNKKIVYIEVCKKNISHTNRNLFDLLTEYKLKDQVIYHAYLRLHLEDNIILKLEKNEIISLEEVDEFDDGFLFKVDTTVKKFFKNGKQVHNKKFWVYDMKKNNCQDFVISMLKGNGLINEKLQNYIKQDSKKILKNFKDAYKIGTFITSIIGLVN